MGSEAATLSADFTFDYDALPKTSAWDNSEMNVSPADGYQGRVKLSAGGTGLQVVEFNDASTGEFSFGYRIYPVESHSGEIGQFLKIIFADGKTITVRAVYTVGSDNLRLQYTGDNSALGIGWTSAHSFGASEKEAFERNGILFRFARRGNLFYILLGDAVVDVRGLDAAYAAGGDYSAARLQMGFQTAVAYSVERIFDYTFLGTAPTIGGTISHSGTSNKSETILSGVSGSFSVATFVKVPAGNNYRHGITVSNGTNSLRFDLANMANYAPKLHITANSVSYQVVAPAVATMVEGNRTNDAAFLATLRETGFWLKVEFDGEKFTGHVGIIGENNQITYYSQIVDNSLLTGNKVFSFDNTTKFTVSIAHQNSDISDTATVIDYPYSIEPLRKED